MSGSVKGGIKAAATNRIRHGEDFYKEIGRKGGRAPHSTPRGFAANPARASIAGAKGGSKSIRGAALSPEKKLEIVNLYREGFSIEDIRKKCGTSNSTVYKVLDKYGR